MKSDTLCSCPFQTIRHVCIKKCAHWIKKSVSKEEKKVQRIETPVDFQSKGLSVSLPNQSAMKWYFMCHFHPFYTYTGLFEFWALLSCCFAWRKSAKHLLWQFYYFNKNYQSNWAVLLARITFFANYSNLTHTTGTDDRRMAKCSRFHMLTKSPFKGTNISYWMENREWYSLSCVDMFTFRRSCMMSE